LTLAAAIPVVLLSAAAIAQDHGDLPWDSVPEAQVSGKPNVVFVVWDTVRADHLSLYGYERDTTPYLRRLANEATVYRRTEATSNFTLPTHASMFTGLYPRSHGGVFAPKLGPLPLRPDVTTLAEVLANNGYRTLAVVANAFYVGPDFGLSQGFHLFDNRFVAHPMPLVRDHYLRQSVRSGLFFSSSFLAFDQKVRRAHEVAASAEAVLDRVTGSTAPFFLFLNFMDAHAPYIPPPPFDALFPGRDLSMTKPRYDSLMKENDAGLRTMSEAERSHYVSQYDGGIAYLDSHFERLIETLKARGLYDDTMIILTSDHGEGFGEHYVVQHGRSPYQTEIHVPLVIKYPGQETGRDVDTLTSHVDLLPTILDVIGAEAPAGLQGMSLLASPDAGRYVVAQDVSPCAGGGFHRRWSVFHGDHKLIQSIDGTTEVYHLSADPGELHNLQRSAAPDLLAKLDEWFETVPLRRGLAKELDATTIEGLKALGYLK
ncbi:MAG: sulfatase, partial [bacterium]|nr:sulfatase [bacterium]